MPASQQKLDQSSGTWAIKSTPSLPAGSPGSTKSPGSNIMIPSEAATKDGFLQTSFSESFLPSIDQGPDRLNRTVGFPRGSNGASDLTLPPTMPRKDFAKTTSSSTSFVSTGETSAASKLQLAQDRLQQLQYEEQDREDGLQEANGRLTEATDQHEAFEAELKRLAEAKALHEQQLSEIAGLGKAGQKLSSWYKARRHEYSESLRQIENKTWEAKRRQHKCFCEMKRVESYLPKQEQELDDLRAKIERITKECVLLEAEAQEEKIVREKTKTVKVKKPRPPKPKGLPWVSQVPNEIAKAQNCKNEGDLWQQAERLGISPRRHIAETLINLYGGAKAALDAMDVNRTGMVSLTEFTYGLQPLALQPKRVLHIFRMYDTDQSNEVSLREIFGDAIADLEGAQEERVQTPCATWVNWYKSMKKSQYRDKQGTIHREPKWVSSRSQLIDDLLQQREHTQQVQDRRNWMQATITRLRKRGLTDSACRELVAQHLPRGQGPKDSSGVRRLDETTVKQERKVYFEKLQGNVSKIQKAVMELRSQKSELRGAVRDLWSVTEKIQLARQEAALQEGSGGGLFSNKPESEEDRHASKQKDELEETTLITKMSTEFSIPEEEVKVIRQEFKELDNDNSGWIEKPEFIALIQKRQKAPLTEVDINTKWNSILRYKSTFSDHVGSGKAAIFELVTKGDASKKENHIAFEHFLLWYWENKGSTHA